MDTSLERIAFDMIKELGLIVKKPVSGLSYDKSLEEIDKAIELYQYTLSKLKDISSPPDQ